MLGQGMVPVLLSTMHGHVRPIAWERVPQLGAPWLPVLPEGSMCLSGKAEVS
jgi:hypothetical protein